MQKAGKYAARRKKKGPKSQMLLRSKGSDAKNKTNNDAAMHKKHVHSAKKKKFVGGEKGCTLKA